MDSIFCPNDRKWISKEVKLTDEISALKAQVEVFEINEKNKRNAANPVAPFKCKVEVLDSIVKNEACDSNEMQNESSSKDDFAETAEELLAAELVEALGGEEFFKVKLKDEKMYNRYEDVNKEDSVGMKVDDLSDDELKDCSSTPEPEDGLEVESLSEWSTDDEDVEDEWKKMGQLKTLNSLMGAYKKALDDELEHNCDDSDLDLDDSRMYPEFDDSDNEDILGAFNTSDLRKEYGIGTLLIDEAKSPELAGQNDGEENVPQTSACSKSLNISKDGNCVKEIAGSSEKSKNIREDKEDFQFFETWALKKMKRSFRCMPMNVKNTVVKKLGIDDATFSMLQNATSPWLATVQGETFRDKPVKKDSSMPVLAPPLSKKVKSTLQSVAIFITHGDDPTGFQWKSSNVQQQINEDIENEAYLRRMRQQAENTENNSDIVDGEDFIVSVVLYHPADFDDAVMEEVKLYLEPKEAFELDVLGSQTLSQLRDNLFCENDLVSLKEVEHPDQYSDAEYGQHFAKSVYPSGMILVNNTIYNDMRHSDESVDYASILNKWCQSVPAKNIGPFKVGDMKNTKIKDLSLRFGYPYVYIHQGNCEHIIVFTKARLLHEEDRTKLSSYPHIVGSVNFKNTYCRVDNEYLARWAVLDYDRFPENPMLICTDCLKSYCYDESGQKHGSFKLFPFKQMANAV